MHEINRTIEIDAGHRIPDHESKCFAIHGHRYRIELGISSDRVHTSGPEKGMVKDFGFLKSVMMQKIHDVCDHSLMLHINDPILLSFVTNKELDILSYELEETPLFKPLATRFDICNVIMPIVVCSFVPTAENLAHAWYDAVGTEIMESTGLLPSYLKVWETPNSTATYRPEEVITHAQSETLMSEEIDRLVEVFRKRKLGGKLMEYYWYGEYHWRWSWLRLRWEFGRWEYDLKSGGKIPTRRWVIEGPKRLI